jgi:hypothetical protein
MPGSLTAPSRPDTRAGASVRLAFRSTQSVGSRGLLLSRLNGWPMRSPADASPLPLRTAAHGLGPMWIATPSSRWTCTTYSSPVSRRTRSEAIQGHRDRACGSGLLRRASRSSQ